MMIRRLALLALCSALLPLSAARADDPKAVIDKAVKALGGEEKLAKAKILSWKTKGVVTFNDMENAISSTILVSGFDKHRNEFDGEFGGNKIQGLTVFDGERGWRKFNDNTMEIDGDGVANEKRIVYLQVVPVLILPLKGREFKAKAGEDVKLGDKSAAVLEITGPDGKGFTIAFDKESGLPVRMTATVPNFGGGEVEQETVYSDYKDFGGIKKATKVEVKRDGKTFVAQQVSDFKVLDKADPDAFKEPK